MGPSNQARPRSQARRAANRVAFMCATPWVPRATTTPWRSRPHVDG
ncbi:hypothetical protein IEQ44_04105 [Nocardioides sp. Y6]|uniref:Uncharacterized protein n=1 Tax=Nocardioides malaquae TaxID=2773426 RepID=A0ABR9RQI8_9ACTN|nr:hypothetical protein [Nocardioides malaquae]MBE7323831.1 hypothetical protein [Nocardioides malaquae]